MAAVPGSPLFRNIFLYLPVSGTFYSPFRNLTVSSMWVAWWWGSPSVVRPSNGGCLGDPLCAALLLLHPRPPPPTPLHAGEHMAIIFPVSVGVCVINWVFTDEFWPPPLHPDVAAQSNMTKSQFPPKFLSIPFTLGFFFFGRSHFCLLVTSTSATYSMFYYCNNYESI